MENELLHANDPDLLRDFIAGAHRQTDDYRSSPDEDANGDGDQGLNGGDAPTEMHRRAPMPGRTVIFVDFAGRTGPVDSDVE